MSGWFVYFIQSGEHGPIKIGRARDVEKRLAELQGGNPRELHLVGFVPGGKQLERELHGRFAADRLRREWFRPSAELLRYAMLAEAINGRYPHEVAGWQLREELRPRLREAGLLSLPPGIDPALTA